MSDFRLPLVESSQEGSDIFQEAEGCWNMGSVTGAPRHDLFWQLITRNLRPFSLFKHKGRFQLWMNQCAMGLPQCSQQKLLNSSHSQPQRQEILSVSPVWEKRAHQACAEVSLQLPGTGPHSVGSWWQNCHRSPALLAWKAAKQTWEVWTCC